MVPLVIPLVTNGNANGTIGPPNGTIGTNGKPMVPLAINGNIGKISNGTIGRKLKCTLYDPNPHTSIVWIWCAYGVWVKTIKSNEE